MKNVTVAQAIEVLKITDARLFGNITALTPTTRKILKALGYKVV